MASKIPRSLLNPINFGSFNNMSGPLESTGIDGASLPAPNITFDANQSAENTNNDANMESNIDENLDDNAPDNLKTAENVGNQLKNVKLEDISAKAIKIEEIEVSISAFQR
jgi:hypothetical protein